MDFFFFFFFGGGFETFLEGSVDRVIYWDYVVNRPFFVYSKPASKQMMNTGNEP